MNYNFTQDDKALFLEKGITESQVVEQLNTLNQGFPYLQLRDAASVENGTILRLTEEQASHYVELWDEYLASGHTIMKFVPASGAASRMFKNLFAYLEGDDDTLMDDFIKTFFENITTFAFYDALTDSCLVNEGKTIEELMEEGSYKTVLRNLLQEEGLNYGNLPKGLLFFHTYNDMVRTPFEEHLVEGALYARGKDDVVHLHYTVSPEHKPLFEQLLNDKKDIYEKQYGVRYHVEFSEQKPSTDTIASTPDGEPFRTDDGTLLFRPAGHGALIENLNELNADIVFIKNIDNVVPDRLKEDMTYYKKVLAGVLVEQCLNRETLKDAPIRVCGMVKNVGEPGGGPFLVEEPDGTTTKQILEGSQIDMTNERSVAILNKSTHFNPVDIVCSITNAEGKKYDLKAFVDPATGFISEKSKDGRELKALELPGLWNGAMSRWNTIFVEVPLSTFNPVKTVNDLLREEHR